MDHSQSLPKDIKRRPINSYLKEPEEQINESNSNPSSYNGQLRAQRNAKLLEEVDLQSSLPNSAYGSYKSYNNEYLNESNLNNFNYGSFNEMNELEISKEVKKHLVNFKDGDSIGGKSNSSIHSKGDSEMNYNEEDNIDNGDWVDSHSLQGGDMTRNIYKWQEAIERKHSLKRSNSLPYLRENYDDEQPNLPAPSELLVPGGFRRHHILTQNNGLGQNRPLENMTSNFLDFLALYGHFAGDVYPLDDEEEDELIAREIEITERTPLQRRRSIRQGNPPPPTGSAGKAVFLLVKSFVGTGVLFLPKSFYDGGMIFSLFVLMFISFLGLHTMLLLVETQALIGGSFGDLGQILFGEWARLVILGSILISQFGFSCTYVIFIAKNLEDVFYGLTNCKYTIPTYYFILIQLLIYIPVAMLRRIKSLSLMALIADAFIILGLIYLIYFNIEQVVERGFAKIQSFNPDNFALFIGTAIFTFEGIGLIIPIVQSMKRPEKFPSILTWTMIGITVVFLFIGSLSYATFGDQTQTVVLSNLPRGELSSQLIQSMYAMAIILSVPLQVFPIIGILEQALFSQSGRGSLLIKWEKNTLRLLIVLSIGFVSWLGASSLNHFVSLVGSFCCIPLSFIYPAAFHLKAVNSKFWIKLKNWLIILLGFIAMIYVTYQTLANWNEDTGDSKPICPPPSF